MTRFLPALAFATAAWLAGAANAAPQKYQLDPDHSQIVFSYEHLGFSTTQSMFAGFNGEIMMDADDPAASSVKIAFPVKSMITGSDARYKDFMSGQFFKDPEAMVTFASTAIEVTGDKSARITGDLTLNGITKPVVLDAVLNQMGENPIYKKPWAGFSATGTVKRSDFGLDAYVPYISDEVKLEISIEAAKAE